MKNSTETTEHRPVDSGWCTCGGQEVYFEDPPYDGALTGYGCEVAGDVWSDELLRRGFHIHPESTIRHLSDRAWDELSQANHDKVQAWIDRHRPGWNP